MPTPSLHERDIPLLAFWVGDHDIFAAEDEHQALALANMLADCRAYSQVQVRPVAADTLDDPLLDSQGRLTGTLRRLLASRIEPGYLAGYEE